MAKRFMYVSIGVLCLVAAYALGTERARAEWNADSPGQLVGMVSDGSSIFVFTRSGSAWTASNDAGWLGPASYADLPVPVDDVAMLGKWTIITKDDVLWVHLSDHWESRGPFPGGPVSQEARSWGSTKGRFR